MLNHKISARIEELLKMPPRAERVYEKAQVQSIWQEGARYMGLQVEVSERFAKAYERLGQYVSVKINGGRARFYVVASRPEQRVWEFLIATGGDIGPDWASLEVGDTVLLSAAEGVGFDVSEARDKKALLFCTGSGVATMRPLIEAWLDGSDRPEEIYLYYGEAREDDFGYEEHLEEWQRRGVKLYRVVEESPDEGSRYVQDVFAAHHPPLDEAYFYLSGAPVMIRMAAQKIMELGGAPERVKVNI